MSGRPSCSGMSRTATTIIITIIIIIIIIFIVLVLRRRVCVCSVVVRRVARQHFSFVFLYFNYYILPSGGPDSGRILVGGVICIPYSFFCDVIYLFYLCIIIYIINNCICTVFVRPHATNSEVDSFKWYLISEYFEV